MKVFRFSAVAALLVLMVSSTWFCPLWAMDEKTRNALMLFSNVLEEIKNNYVDEVDPETLVKTAIDGMMETLDPYSGFLTPENFAALQENTQGEFGGIGVSVALIKGKVTVVFAIEGTPAHRAGIRTGDVIVRIDGRPTQRMAVWECETELKGPQGTHVRVTYAREGVPEPVECLLTRDLVPRQSVQGIMIDPKGLGYIAITQFRDNTVEKTTDALETLEASESGLNGLILDLRNNPGGRLNQAVEVSDLFLETGVIVSMKGRHPQYVKVFEAQESPIKRTYPVVVLINGGSASASEIVAGALQDHKRAVILGSTSFGKGSVQTVLPLSRGYGLKYTIARYYTPANRSIQDRGIQPDIEVEQVIQPLVPGKSAKKENSRESTIIDLLKQDSQIDRALKILAQAGIKN